MVKRITLILFIIYAVIIGVVIYSLSKDKSELNDENLNLKRENSQLKEKIRVCDLNMSSICHAGADYQGDIRYINCGESFIDRWATCICTTMCLQDFTVTVTNSEQCRIWPSVPIQIRPEPDDEEEENEEEDES